MNKYQTAKLDSYKLIYKESTANPESIQLIPKFEKGVTRLGEITNEADKLAVEQEKDRKGITEEKGKTIDNLIEYTVEISGAIHSYAQTNNNLVLLEKVNYPTSAWEKMDNAELLTEAGIVIDEMKNVPVEVLAEEGITEADMTALEDLYNYYKDIKSSPREAIIDRSGITAKLKDLFKEAHKIVKGSLDKLAVQFKRKDPDFYLIYQAARNIDYRKARKREEERE